MKAIKKPKGKQGVCGPHRADQRKGPNIKKSVPVAKPKEDDNARRQAFAQLESIVDMVTALQDAEEKDDQVAREAAYEAIQEDPLCVEMRSDWHSPGVLSTRGGEYKILLCTGGPAVQITGELNDFNQPETAQIEYQDWFTPWTPLAFTAENEEAMVLAYAQQFYFGE